MSEWSNFVTTHIDEALLANTMFIDPRATYRIVDESRRSALQEDGLSLIDSSGGKESDAVAEGGIRKK
jgi:hypothetical protein